MSLRDMGLRKIFAISIAMCEFTYYIEPYFESIQQQCMQQKKIFIFAHRHLFLMVSYSQEK